MDQSQKRSDVSPPRPADTRTAGAAAGSRSAETPATNSDSRSASDVVPRDRERTLSSDSSQLKRSNSLARLRAAALDLESELSHKETAQQELERRVSEGVREVQTLRARVQALEAELAGARAATRLETERARLAHEVLQDEQDAFLALLLDEHEVEISQLKRERDEMLAKAALAEHKQLRGHDLEELERRLTWLRGECDEAHREADDARKEADEARDQRDRAFSQRDAAVEENERLRNLINASEVKQRPTQPELALDLPPSALAASGSGALRPSPSPTQPDSSELKPQHRPALGAGRTTATAVPVAMIHARNQLAERASIPSTLPPPKDTSDGSLRQGARTAPAVPAPSVHADQPEASSAPVARAFELDTLPPPAPDADLFASVDEPGALSQPDLLDALDMTRDLDWGGATLHADAPAPAERKTARPIGPADQPPVVLKKPNPTRSPGGYSMPDDASGTIEVLKPLGPAKR